MLKISIVTAVLNNAATLPDCIESVLAQTYPAEHLIIDGGSTDGSLQVLKSYGNRLAHVISGPDRGMYDAMNNGIRLAKGDIIGILNGDDFYSHSDVIARVASTFQNGAIDSCYGDLEYVDPEDTRKVLRLWRSGPCKPNSFYQGWMLPHPTFFVRKTVYERYGLFNLDLGSAADYELMLRFLLRHEITAAYIPEVLVHMRAGGISNCSLRNRIRANLMDRKAWAVNGIKPFPWTLLLKPLRKIAQFKIQKTINHQFRLIIGRGFVRF